MKTIEEAVREVIQNEEELKRVLKMRTAEEVIECIKAHDCEATVEEASAEFAKQYKSRDIHDVGGGRRHEDVGDLFTTLKCTECGETRDWIGDFLNQTFDCPKCGKHSFKGINLDLGLILGHISYTAF